MRTVFLSLTMFATLCAIPAYWQQAGNPQAADQPDNAALLQKIRDLEDRLIAVEGQLRVLQAAQPGEQAQPTVEPTPSATSAFATSEAGTQAGVLGGAGGSAAKALNPDISAIG